MARTITLYKIFVASPSDLKEERIMIEEIIEELNISVFNNSDIKIELQKWETHVNPDVGEYPQQVINEKIGIDYDIFIGMLWSKFGTPTQNYGSGTEEEFHLAYQKYKESPSSVNIMFYFKQAPIPIEKIDTNSINALRKFKSELGDKGILYWEYLTIEEFQKLLRIQLTRKIKELILSKSESVKVVQKEVITSEEVEVELGLIDYLEQGEENFKDIEEILYRMTDAVEWIGKRFTEKTEEINKKIAQNPAMGNKTKRKLVNSAADDMNSFNSRLKAEIPLFSETYKKGIDSFSNAIKISIDIKADKEEDIESTISSIDSFVNSISESSKTCVIFRQQIDEFPRLTKEFNTSKRLSSNTLGDLIKEFGTAIKLPSALKNEFEDYKAKY